MAVDHPPICDYEDSDYQTSFWDQGERAYEDRVEAVALERLLPQAGEILLEVGAGAGRNTPRYRNFKRVVVLDYSLTQLQQAVMQPVPDKGRHAGETFRLGYFVLMVRKYKVLPAAMYIKCFAQVFQSHGAAFYVPPRPALTPRTGPERLSRLGRLP